jgi:DHA1 family bicyclomycin/chloramphenicol resistance-like MFS transporter
MLAATALAVGIGLGFAMDGSVLPLTNTVGTMALATAWVGWTLVQRHGESR